MGWINTWRRWAGALRLEAYALYFAFRDPRTPWYAKAVAVAVATYALSPIDLIPDPIPVLGQLDDLVIVPLGVWLARKLIPVEVMARARADPKPRSPGEDARAGSARRSSSSSGLPSWACSGGGSGG